MTTGFPRWKRPGIRWFASCSNRSTISARNFSGLRWRPRSRAAVLGINPFNQPDVEAAKIKTRELTAAFEKTGSLPKEHPVISTAEADIYTDDKNAAALRKAGANGDLGSWLKAHLGALRRGRLCGAARLYRTRPCAYRQPAAHAAGGARQAACRDLRRIRPALPAFHRTGLQGRARQRRISADHGRRRQGSRRARPKGQLRRDQGRAGPRRFRRADRTRPPRAARASQGRSRSRTEDARCRRCTEEFELRGMESKCSSA